MENKKINVLFCVAVIAFLAVSIILIKEFRAERESDVKTYLATLSNIVHQKNDKIRILYSQLVEKEREAEDLKNTLTETRNGLENLSKKLAQPALVAAPASAPAPVAATK